MAPADPWTVFVKKVAASEREQAINAISKTVLDVNEDKNSFIVFLRSDVCGVTRGLAPGFRDCKSGSGRANVPRP